MTDQLLIGEVVCKLLNEFGLVPKIEKHPQGETYRVIFEYQGKKILLVTTSLEGCLTECYNCMKNINEGVNAGGGHG